MPGAGASPQAPIRPEHGPILASVNRRIARWERLTAGPLAVAALLFLVAFALPIVRYRQLDPTVAAACDLTVSVTWGLFVLDYVVRLALATPRLGYALRHWFDLLVIVLPVLRPLQLLRLIPVLRALNRGATRSLAGRIGVYAASGAVLLTFVGGLAVLDAERRDPDANITSVGDALWWATTTVTSVGYGDLYPVTAMGRFVAVGLMVGGIGVLGAVTALMASWLVGQVAAESGNVERALREEIALLREDVAALRTDLARPRDIRPPGNPQSPDPAA